MLIKPSNDAATFCPIYHEKQNKGIPSVLLCYVETDMKVVWLFIAYFKVTKWYESASNFTYFQCIFYCFNIIGRSH